METEVKWRDLHNKATVIDAHSDITADVVRLRSEGETDVFGRVHLEKWRAGGVNGAICTVGGDQLREPTPYEYAIETTRLFELDVADRSQDLAIVTDPKSFAARVESGRVTFGLSIEGSSPFEGSLEKLRTLYEKGVRFVTLTWSAANEVGDGVGTDKHGGLTDFGREAIKEMASLGMVSDVSHASEKTFWDTLSLETGNVIASHSNAAAVSPHPRNLTDDQIRAVAEQGGFVGICIFPDFFAKDTPTVHDVVDHVAYVADLVGMQHIALGLDFFDFLPAEEARARLAKATTITGDITYPSYVQGLEGIEKLGRLTEVLVDRGFASQEIEAVLGGNLLRVWSAIDSRSVVRSNGNES